MALRGQRQMVGQIGFHTKPGAAYLKPYAPEGVEFGYSVFPPFRRQGYAREACRALMRWAHEQQQVSAFVVTIAPENEPSRRLALQLGFERIGAHVDEEDGPEDIFRLDASSS
jgi:RimJ/RimL family protein N-acetyltransferase